MIWLRRLVLTMRFAVELNHIIPPAGTTVQPSDEASFRISEISSADAGETMVVPLWEWMFASPTICASDVFVRCTSGKGGLNSSLRLCDSFAPLRENSPQPRSIGTIFPGLQRPNGSNAARTLNIAL